MTRTNKATLSILAATAVLAVAGAAFAQSAPATTAPASLAQGFVTPPDSAKPRTWWHWTNGNVTETGITKDIEWMKRVGIGGFQLVDVASGNGQVVEPKINFGTPEWYHAVLHSAQLAKRLNMEMSIFSCAGWSEAGGPWVTPQMAMKRLVWSETDVTGRVAVYGEAGGSRRRTKDRCGIRARAEVVRTFIRTARWSRTARRRTRCRWPRCIRR